MLLDRILGPAAGERRLDCLALRPCQRGESIGVEPPEQITETDIGQLRFARRRASKKHT